MILASQSPRRIELMREAGFDIRVIPADIDEAPREDEDPFALVARLSETKARSVLNACADTGEIVVAADTIVTVDGRALGKPADEDEARTMLQELSGRTHQVATGVCITRRVSEGSPVQAMSFTSITDVAFYRLTPEQIDAYVASGEPLDKAGAYGIQGVGGRMLVSGIRGDFYNVVGLPIAEVARCIELLEGCPEAPTATEDAAWAEAEADEADELFADEAAASPEGAAAGDAAGDGMPYEALSDGEPGEYEEDAAPADEDGTWDEVYADAEGLEETAVFQIPAEDEEAWEEAAEDAEAGGEDAGEEAWDEAIPADEEAPVWDEEASAYEDDADWSEQGEGEPDAYEDGEAWDDGEDAGDIDGEMANDADDPDSAPSEEQDDLSPEATAVLDRTALLDQTRAN